MVEQQTNAKIRYNWVHDTKNTEYVLMVMGKVLMDIFITILVGIVEVE